MCPPRPLYSNGRGKPAELWYQWFIVGHQHTLCRGIQKHCRSSNLISGIIESSLPSQIIFLSTVHIFSCETLIRKFKKSQLQRKHLAAIFTFDVLHFLPFPIKPHFVRHFLKATAEAWFTDHLVIIRPAPPTPTPVTICKEFFQRNNCSLSEFLSTQAIQQCSGGYYFQLSIDLPAPAIPAASLRLLMAQQNGKYQTLTPPALKNIHLEDICVLHAAEAIGPMLHIEVEGLTLSTKFANEQMLVHQDGVDQRPSPARVWPWALKTEWQTITWKRVKAAHH